MKAKNNVLVLLENGFHFDFVSRLNPKEISILAEKVYKRNQETKEAVQTVQQTGYKTTVTPGTKANLNVNGADISVDPQKGITMTTSTKPVGTGEVTEKFQSKKQQGLFWARCNRCESKNCKWCKMAKEFSDKTTKKDYENMPDEVAEDFFTKKQPKGKSSEEIENYLEDRIFEMIERHINPSMTKGELINTILEKVAKRENMILKNPKKMSMFSKDEGMEMKTPIGKMFSMSGEMKEDTKEKDRTKERDRAKERDKDRRGNPFKDPNPDVDKTPRANTKEKERTREKDRTKEKDKGRRGNPFKDPNPDVQEKPKAGQETEKQKSDFMQVITMALK